MASEKKSNLQDKYVCQIYDETYLKHLDILRQSKNSTHRTAKIRAMLVNENLTPEQRAKYEAELREEKFKMIYSEISLLIAKNKLSKKIEELQSGGVWNLKKNKSDPQNLKLCELLNIVDNGAYAPSNIRLYHKKFKSWMENREIDIGDSKKKTFQNIVKRFQETLQTRPTYESMSVNELFDTVLKIMDENLIPLGVPIVQGSNLSGIDASNAPKINIDDEVIELLQKRAQIVSARMNKLKFQKKLKIFDWIHDRNFIDKVFNDPKVKEMFLTQIEKCAARSGDHSINTIAHYENLTPKLLFEFVDLFDGRQLDPNNDQHIALYEKVIIPFSQSRRILGIQNFQDVNNLFSLQKVIMLDVRERLLNFLFMEFIITHGEKTNRTRELTLQSEAAHEKRRGQRFQRLSLGLGL